MQAFRRLLLLKIPPNRSVVDLAMLDEIPFSPIELTAGPSSSSSSPSHFLDTGGFFGACTGAAGLAFTCSSGDESIKIINSENRKACSQTCPSHPTLVSIGCALLR